MYADPLTDADPIVEILKSQLTLALADSKSASTRDFNYCWFQ